MGRSHISARRIFSREFKIAAVKDIKTAWRKALDLAGIPHIAFHCAGRHTFGTRAAEGGALQKTFRK
jgi:hypothetical protein